MDWRLTKLQWRDFRRRSHDSGYIRRSLRRADPSTSSARPCWRALRARREHLALSAPVLLARVGRPDRGPACSPTPPPLERRDIEPDGASIRSMARSRNREGLPELHFRQLPSPYREHTERTNTLRKGRRTSAPLPPSARLPTRVALEYER